MKDPVGKLVIVFRGQYKGEIGEVKFRCATDKNAVAIKLVRRNQYTLMGQYNDWPVFIYVDRRNIKLMNQKLMVMV